jgi:hypothetical protein
MAGGGEGEDENSESLLSIGEQKEPKHYTVL